jgi:hypothetical protein
MAYRVCDLHGRFLVPPGHVVAWACPDCQEGLPPDPFIDDERDTALAWDVGTDGLIEVP